jgi:hypothetical protein
MLNYLGESGIPDDEITFVYGDTHTGGWGELPRDSGPNIRIYNCGGWVAETEDDHPACHLFVVDEEGEEYLFDITYKDVYIGGESILSIAARDYENRKRLTSVILRFLLKLLTGR